MQIAAGFRILFMVGMGLIAACTSIPETLVHTAPAPPTRHYPDGVGQVLGISATPEFLADSVTAAADRRRLAADGFHIVRFDMLWQEVEPAPGSWQWTEYDRNVDTLLASGFEPLILLAYGNPSYYPDDRSCPMPDGTVFPCMGDDYGPYYRYVEAVVQRYGARVKLYEIWNEPNGWFRFWPTVEGGDPAAMAVLTRTSADRIHALCGDCRVISGGQVYLPTPITMGQVDYMAAMRAKVSDIFAAVDGIGFHQYSFYPPVDAPELREPWQTPHDEAMASVTAVCQCATPLWVTETGWTAVGRLTQEDRAHYGLRGMLMALTQGAQSWLWWSHRDLQREHIIAGAELHFGLLDTAGQPHPIYTALTTAMRTLGEAVAVTDVRTSYGLESPYEWAVRFEWPDGHSATLWTATPDANREVAALRGRTGTLLASGESVPAQILRTDPVLVER